MSEDALHRAVPEIITTASACTACGKSIHMPVLPPGFLWGEQEVVYRIAWVDHAGCEGKWQRFVPLLTVILPVKKRWWQR